MGFKLLRICEVFIAALGGTPVRFTFGIPDIYNKVMSELGLVEGGMSSCLHLRAASQFLGE